MIFKRTKQTIWSLAMVMVLLVGGSTGVLSRPLQASYATVQDGAWTDPATWGETALYPSTNADDAVINHQVSMGQNIVVGRVQINSGGELVLNSFTLTVDSDGTPGGIFFNDGTLTAGSSTVLFQGRGGTPSIGGSVAVTFNNLTVNNALEILTAPTINGQLSMVGNLSSLSGLSPNYTTNSTLNYNGFGSGVAGGQLTGTEWGTLNEAIPWQVLLSNNAAVQLAGDRATRGDVTIDTATLYQNNNSLTVAGNLQLGDAAASVPLGSLEQGGGTLNLAGDFVNYVAQGFVGDGSVILTGGNQQILGNADYTFGNLSKTATTAETLSFAANLTYNIRNSLALNGSDASAVLTLSKSGTGNDPVLNVTSATTLEWLNVNNSVGAGQTITATDSSGTNASGTWIIVETVNQPPSNLTLSSRTVAEGQPSGTVVGSFSTTDADATDTHTYSFATGPGDTDNGSFQITGDTLSTAATLDYDVNNLLSIFVQTMDNNGATFQKQFTINVTDVNNPPVVANAIPDQTATQDELFNFAFDADTFSDPDATDQLTYQADLSSGDPLPAWLTFSSSTRSFAGTPDNTAVGQNEIRVSATDTASNSVSTTFMLTVTNINDLPYVANTIPPQTATQAEPFTYTFAADTFSDPDGETLTYSANQSNGLALPTWLNFAGSTRTFTGTPGTDDGGELVVRVVATDPDGSIATTNFTITVRLLQPELHLSKQVNTTTPSLGEQMLFSMVAQNMGLTDATNVTLFDQLPAGLTFAGPVTFEGGLTTAETQVATAAADLPMLVQGLTLPAGEQVTVQFAAWVDVDALPDTRLTNTATISSAELSSIATASVGFTVAGFGQGMVTVEPQSLLFTSEQAGSDPPPQQLNLRNISAGPLDWTVSTAATWLTLETATESGSIVSGTAPETINLHADPAGLASGTYEAVVVVEDGVQTIPVSVQLLLRPTPPPALAGEAAGNGQLRGMVQTVAGTPIAGATVLAFYEGETTAGRYALATSDAAGQFQFSGLNSAASWQVQAQPPQTGDYAAYLPSASHTASPGETVMLTLGFPGSGVIEGMVLTTDDEPVPTAYVIATPDITGVAEPISALVNEAGMFTLVGLNARTRWNLTLNGPDTGQFAAYVSVEQLPTVDLAVQGTAEAGQVIYQLPKTLRLAAPNLSGQYLLAGDSNTPLGGATAFINPLDETGSPYLDGTTREIVTTETGEFEFALLEPGRYQLALSEFSATGDYGDYRLPDPTNFTIEAITEVVNLGSLTVPLARKEIQGTVEDWDGFPMAGVLVEALRVDDNSGSLRSTTTNANGDYLLTVPEGTWLVSPSMGDSAAAAWQVMNKPALIEFTVGASSAEQKTAHFTVAVGEVPLTVQVIGPSGAPFSGSSPRTDAALELYEVDTATFYRLYLGADGQLATSILPGTYQLTLWLDTSTHPTLSSPPLGIQQIESGLDLGRIQLQQSSGTVSGEVYDATTGEPLAFINMVIWQPDGRWFNGQTDSMGRYQLTVPVGQWQVSPQEDAAANFVFADVTEQVTVSSNQPNQTADFALLRASERFSGQFVDDKGEIVDIRAMVYLQLSGDTRRLVSTPVARGQFELPLPDLCAEVGCEVGTDLADDATYQLLESARRQTRQAQTIQFSMAKNSTSMAGHFYDPETNEIVTGLTGRVYLTEENDDVTYSAHIHADGSYALTNIPSGQFQFNYELALDMGETLALGQYLPQPINLPTFALQPGPNTRLGVTLERGQSFMVTVEWNTAEISRTDFYPTFVVCQKPQLQIQQCNKQAVATGWAATCAIGMGEEKTARLNAAQSEQSDCQVQFGNTAQNSTANARQFNTVAKMPSPAQPLGETPGSLTVQARTRNQLINGQVLFADNSPAANVQVTAHAKGRDGQVTRTRTDANGAYQLAVNRTSSTWVLSASATKNGFYYKDQTTFIALKERIRQGNGQVITAPALQLTATSETVAPPTSYPFNAQEPLSYGPAGFGSTAKGKVPNMLVRATENSLPTQKKQLSLSLSEVSAPETSYWSPLGPAQEIKFFEQQDNRPIQSRNHVRMSVSLPYDNELLAERGLSPDMLQVAYFSEAHDAWVPLPQRSVDRSRSIIKSWLDQPYDMLAVVVPAEEVDFEVGENELLVPLGGVNNVEIAPGVFLTIAPNTFTDTVMLYYISFAETGTLYYSLYAQNEADEFLAPSQPYTITTIYNENIFAEVSESELQLYYGSSGSWQLVPSTVDPLRNSLTASPSTLGFNWAIAVSSPAGGQLFLPFIPKNGG